MKYFITATGTGIGKTLVTCALVSQTRARGKEAKAIKPIISGFAAACVEESDTGQLLQAQELALTQSHIDALSPWRFAAPLSPDMAAEAEGKSIDFNALVQFCQEQDGGEIFIEGAGGVMTPISSQYTMLDWMEALGLPVILVTGSYLGTLSHTLTAVEVIRARGLALQAVVISESPSPPVPLATLCASMGHFLPASVPLLAIKRLDSSPGLWKYAPNLLSIIQ